MNVEVGGGKPAKQSEQEKQRKREAQETNWEPEPGGWEENNTLVPENLDFLKPWEPGVGLLPPKLGELYRLPPMPSGQSINEAKGRLDPINPRIKGNRLYPDYSGSGRENLESVQDTIRRVEDAVDRDMMIEKGKKNYGQEDPFSNAGQYPRNDVEYMFYLQDEGKDFQKGWESFWGTINSSNGDPEKYLYMLQSERDAYSYELARSPEAGRKFLKSLDETLNFRKDVAGQESAKQFGAEHPVMASLASGLGKAAVTVPLISQLIEEHGAGRDADPSSGYRATLHYLNAMKDGVLERAEDPTTKSIVGALYDLPGAIPTAVTSIFLSPAAGALMGSVQNGAMATDRAVQNGADSEGAFLYGAGAGTLNYLVGKLPVSKLSSLMQSGEEEAVKNVLADFLEQAGIKTLKSSTVRTVDGLYDELVHQEKSRVGRYQQELMEDGMSKADALWKAREKYYRSDAFRDSLTSSLLGTAMNNFGK